MALGINFSTRSVSFGSLLEPISREQREIRTIPTEVIAELLKHAGGEDAKASEAATEIGRAIALELGQVHLGSSTLVAVPASVGPLGRRALASGLCRAGISVSTSDIVDQPLAALAAWQSTISVDSSETGVEPSTLALLIMNDRRALSGVVADPTTRSVLSQSPLTASPFESVQLVRSRLIDLVTAAQPALEDGVIEIQDWARSSARVASVVIVGQPNGDQELPELCEQLFPGATHTVEPNGALLGGLGHLNELQGWRCRWPTGVTWHGDTILRNPGPVLDPENVTATDPAPALRFSDAAGVRYLVAAGSVVAEGILLSGELAAARRFRFLPDGRLLVLPEGAKPLCVRVGWPVPGTAAATVRLVSVGRRAAELTNPRVSPRRPATVPL